MNIKKETFLELWWPVIIFALLTFIFSIRLVESGKMVFGHDISLMGKYYDVFNASSISKGQIPYWIPYVFSGMPHQAITILFYPTHLLAFLLNLSMANFILFTYVIHIFLAGLCMYLFTRSLDLSKTGAVFSGVVWMFCGHLVTLVNAGHLNNVYAIALIPLIFYFIEKGIKKEALSYFLFASVIVGLQILGSGYQFMVYNMMVLGIYFLYRLRSAKLKYKLILYFAIFILFIPLISAFQFFPMFFYSRLSTRGAPDYNLFTSWSFHPLETIIYLMPRFFGLIEETYWGHFSFDLTSDYIGILPLFLSFTSIFFLIKDKRVIFFSILSAMALWLAYGGYTPLYRLLFHVPIISGFRTPARWLAFFSFAVSILAGIGLDFLIKLARKDYKEETLKRFKIVLIGLSSVTVILWMVFYFNSGNIISSMQNWTLIKQRFGAQSPITNILFKMITGDMLKLAIFCIISVGLILFAMNSRINKYLLLAIGVAIFLADVWMLEMKIVRTMPVEENDARRTEISQFLKQDQSLYRVFPTADLHNKNWFITERIQSIGGYHGYPLQGYKEFVSNVGEDNTNFLNLLNVKYILINNLINHPNFKLLLNGSVKIYENLSVLPRVYLVNNVLTVKDNATIYSMLRDPSYNSGNSVIIQDEFNEKVDRGLENKDNSAVITNYDINEINMDVKSSINSVLVLSEIYYPEWKAYIDGNETKIYKAYGILRSIYVPQGSHQVKFKYVPSSFYRGVIVTIMSVIVLIGVCLFEAKKKKTELI